MKLYDISQEVFSCCVYPGDPKPERQRLRSTEAGERYNLTAFSMCAHNGTHIDAPFHFLLEGVVLHSVPEGRYFLSAAPLNLAGADGAPCRAYLIEWEEKK